MPRNRVTSLCTYPAKLAPLEPSLPHVQYQAYAYGQVEGWRYLRQAEHLYVGQIGIRTGLFTAGLTDADLIRIAMFLRNSERASKVTRGMIAEALGIDLKEK